MRKSPKRLHESDHVGLAQEVHRLHALGCHVVLTNSNHPLVHKLYSRYQISIHQTQRRISSKPQTRLGEDVIVVAASGCGS